MAGAEQFLVHHRRLTRIIHDVSFPTQSRQAKLAELASFCAQTLSVDRVAIWRMQNQGDFMACEYLHRTHASCKYQPSGLPVLERQRYPNYFATLTDTGLICAEHAQSDPQLAEFGAEFLAQQNIASALQVPVYGHHGLEGTVALASATPGRSWQANDIALASAVAETISLTNFRDDWRASQQLLEYMALHDSVTHLPNQSALTNHLNRHVIEASKKEPTVLLWLDIDRFKSVTEVLGETGLNQVVSLVAMRLQSCCCRAGEMVARLSKDEFAVVLQTGPGNNAKNGGDRISALQRTLSAPYEINERTLNLTTSIGVAPYQSQTVKLWLRQAESAMLEAKSTGGDCSVYFTDRLQGERDR
ncbi:MAG: diguanylate cyclase, partial [Natronospirillum sp.]